MHNWLHKYGIMAIWTSPPLWKAGCSYSTRLLCLFSKPNLFCYKEYDSFQLDYNPSIFVLSFHFLVFLLHPSQSALLHNQHKASGTAGRWRCRPQALPWQQGVMVEAAMAWWAGACCLPGPGFTMGGCGAGSGTPMQSMGDRQPRCGTGWGQPVATRVQGGEDRLWQQNLWKQPQGKPPTVIAVLDPAKTSVHYWHPVSAQPFPLYPLLLLTWPPYLTALSSFPPLGINLHFSASSSFLVLLCSVPSFPFSQKNSTRRTRWRQKERFGSLRLPHRAEPSENKKNGPCSCIHLLCIHQEGATMAFTHILNRFSYSTCSR